MNAENSGSKQNGIRLQGLIPSTPYDLNTAAVRKGYLNPVCVCPYSAYTRTAVLLYLDTRAVPKSPDVAQNTDPAATCLASSKIKFRRLGTRNQT